MCFCLVPPDSPFGPGLLYVILRFSPSVGPSRRVPMDAEACSEGEVVDYPSGLVFPHRGGK